mmetsp:Transcript_12577/g.27281  ORF Transcript_12577/g.27281 Transcript_12577/m.27281 type:complete len:228 (+) Transcript_12577:408-1091(+)
MEQNPKAGLIHKDKGDNIPSQASARTTMGVQVTQKSEGHPLWQDIRMKARIIKHRPPPRIMQHRTRLIRMGHMDYQNARMQAQITKMRPLTRNAMSSTHLLRTRYPPQAFLLLYPSQMGYPVVYLLELIESLDDIYEELMVKMMTNKLPTIPARVNMMKRFSKGSSPSQLSRRFFSDKCKIWYDRRSRSTNQPFERLTTLKKRGATVVGRTKMVIISHLKRELSKNI